MRHASYMHGSRDTRMSATHVTHMNESCHIYEGIVTANGSLGPGSDASKVRKWGTGGPGYNIKGEAT